jgi:TolB-like protein
MHLASALRPASLALGLALLSTPLRAQAPTRAGVPTVAVLYFNNSALVRRASYEPLTKGIADMMIGNLISNPSIRVVERDQLQKILDELKLSSSGVVDAETAVRVGKVLGAHHILTGGFVISEKEKMRLALRSVNVETTEVEYAETVSGKSEDVLELIGELATKVSAGLHLPPLPVREGVGSPAPAAPDSGKATAVAVSAADRYRAFYLVCQSIEEQDKKHIPEAIALLREALRIYPTFTRAQVRLAVLEKNGETGR